MQNTLSPTLRSPHLLVFAGDHGITAEGVSAYPQDVTWQMVLNFLNGGAAINVFAQQHAIRLRVIDAGVNAELPAHPKLSDAKIAYGTKNFLTQAAMTQDECHRGLQLGASHIDHIQTCDCNIVGFGEMGVGNTSAAAAIMSRVCGLPLEACVGRGTGLNDTQLRHKIEVLRRALHHHPAVRQPLDVLRTFGGFELVQMCGAMLQAAHQRMLVLVDGFIATAAFLIASRLQPAIQDYAIFCHVSDEHGHRRLLQHLGASPLLDLRLRLGEGTGCALAYSLIDASVRFLNDMASFEQAGVAGKKDAE
ncbi:MAG: nicotinate-nucleotide--dimethylbenzimidazole phosphoribosyltransferase [Desulfurellaceae bacterium]|nr:nicotinate-nucleotide--dimethylbenzimidazole phosphoribosyltransferase [Desulfurellaceae bacterium]